MLDDVWHKSSSAVKKALSVIVYALGKSSFGFLGKLCGVSRTTAYYWMRNSAETMAEPVIAANIHASEFDEMGHVLQSKKDNLDHQSRGSLHRENYRLGTRWS